LSDCVFGAYEDLVRCNAHDGAVACVQGGHEGVGCATADVPYEPEF
jgi:hypothetical protein